MVYLIHHCNAFILVYHFLDKHADQGGECWWKLWSTCINICVCEHKLHCSSLNFWLSINGFDWKPWEAPGCTPPVCCSYKRKGRALYEVDVWFIREKLEPSAHLCPIDHAAANTGKVFIQALETKDRAWMEMESSSKQRYVLISSSLCGSILSLWSKTSNIIDSFIS